MINLKKLREAKNLTLRDLAPIANTTHSQLSRVENGKAKLKQKQILQLSHFFNVSADYLLGLSDIPNPEPHKFHYYSESNNLLTIEDIIDKYKHSNISIVFAPDFIKVRFDNDPEKSEIKYTRVK